MKKLAFFVHLIFLFAFTHGYKFVCLHNTCIHKHTHWECQHENNQIVECGADGICAEFSQFGKFQPSDILDRRRCIKKSTITDIGVRNRLAQHQDFCKIGRKDGYMQRSCYCSQELCNHKFRLPESFTLMKHENKTHFRQEHHH